MSEIKGYKPLTEKQIALINEAKVLEEQVLRYVDKLSVDPDIHPDFLRSSRFSIMGAFMFMNRAVTRPERIMLDGDPSAEVIINGPPE